MSAKKDDRELIRDALRKIIASKAGAAGRLLGGCDVKPNDDLTAVQEIEKSPSGAVKVKFVNKCDAMKTLWELSRSDETGSLVELLEAMRAGED